jgi:hypothetical protein
MAEQVSERDREYMKRLGRYKAESHAEALARQLSRSPRERLEYAVSTMLRGSYFPGRPVYRDDDDPAALYERAKQLGYYRAV